ncbi:hypothetical protein [Bailinhaonella thermotolerans]|uniref:Uncharacterized protein n=1 Tax=Bailinhaonella thermotolerans TaxID=1070861 RepID=A0A3A4AXB3_9ACTN|nr:hypothetical protein [Bailinhaonella thermotolerans]RJL32034.1 hypothetical protein D5H75_16515 [Bailinhaonella thermotolerans]
MGLTLVLRTPRPSRKTLRRATRAQRRDRRAAEAAEWETTRRLGRFLDVEVLDLSALVDRAGRDRLPVLGRLDPWKDAVFHHDELPRLEGEAGLLVKAAADDRQRRLATALRDLLARWRAEPHLLLYCDAD